MQHLYAWLVYCIQSVLWWMFCSRYVDKHLVFGWFIVMQLLGNLLDRRANTPVGQTATVELVWKRGLFNIPTLYTLLHTHIHTPLPCSLLAVPWEGGDSCCIACRVVILSLSGVDGILCALARFHWFTSKPCSKHCNRCDYDTHRHSHTHINTHKQAAL